MSDNKTKVFISWSGERSKALALALSDFIGDVLQNVQPFVSDRDIAAGQRWLQRLDEELRETRHGILCLTRDNLSSTWMHYEAGALAKSFTNRELICTCLLDVQNSDVEWPLAQFQHKSADKTGIREIIMSINGIIDGHSLPPERLERQFERCWKDLERKIEEIPSLARTSEDTREESRESPTRSDRELLVEILETIRQQSRRFVGDAPPTVTKIRNGKIVARSQRMSDADWMGLESKGFGMILQAEGADETRFLSAISALGGRITLKSSEVGSDGLRRTEVSINFPIPFPVYEITRLASENAVDISLLGTSE